MNALVERKPFIGFALDRESLEAIVHAVKGLGWGPQNVLYGDIDMAVTNLKDVPTPKRVIVDLSNSKDPIKDLSGLADVCDAGTMVTAIGTRNDLTLYKELKQAGVSEYLLKPLDASSLNLTLDPPKASRDEDESEWANRIIAVAGAGGGVGTTTVASNLAWLYAHKEGRKTALLELDPWFGTAAFNLGLEASTGMIEALQDPTRIDSLFIQRAMSVESENLYVLASEPDLREATPLDPNAVGILIQRLAPEFDRLVLDLPRCNAGVLSSALSQASRVLVVSDQSMVGVRDTIRLAELAESVSPHLNFGVVLNRVGDKGRSNVTSKQFGKAVNQPIVAEFPEEPKAIAAAAAAGTALAKAAPNCQIIKSMKKNWETLTGTQHVKKTHFWQRLGIG